MLVFRNEKPRGYIRIMFESYMLYWKSWFLMIDQKEVKLAMLAFLFCGDFVKNYL